MLPNGEITQKDVERLWVTDRQALIQCGKRHGALAAFIKDRDSLLAP